MFDVPKRSKLKYARIQDGFQVRVVAVSDDELCYTTQIDDGHTFPGDMQAWIRHTSGSPAKAIANGQVDWSTLAGVKVLAPVVPDRNIFCVGKNYKDHAREFQQSGFDTSSKDGEHAPPVPVIFTKPTSSIVANGDPVMAHGKVTSQLDYEAELAVIIGKGGKDIETADAWSHVYGYTIVNDVTARDLQQTHRQWFLGKSIDTFCPMGPWLVTADSLDAANLRVQCHINGELRQNASTADLIFDIPTLIQTISALIELHPGDVISTGTPAGVGIGFKPPRFLQPGDKMTISISGIGMLTNSIQ